MVNNYFIFAVSLIMLIRGATLATKYAALLAESYRLSTYAVGFVVVAVISILPETLISINAALEGMPSFGLATLFGSNIADLTLLFFILVFISKRGLKVESKILKKNHLYPLILLFPLILGLDAYYSRLEGTALILLGIIFYYHALKNGIDTHIPKKEKRNGLQYFLKLCLSMGLLLVGSHFTVTSSISIAEYFYISPTLIGMLVVGLGTTMPELFFSIKSVRKDDNSLAVGDLLGTVLADATIVVGIIALISPFSFPIKILYVSGIFMVLSAFLLFYFMKSGRNISKREAMILLFFWFTFVFVELFTNI